MDGSHVISIPRKVKDLLHSKKNKKIRNYIFEINVPEDTRGTMLKALDRHGINSHTLFPDLEGLCKYLNWRHNISL